MYVDIRKEILKHLDINELSIICQTDRNFTEICNSKDFWHNYFTHHKLRVLNNPNNMINWIILFKYTKEIDIKTNYILNHEKFGRYQSVSLDENTLKYVIIGVQSDELINFFNNLINDMVFITIIYHNKDYILELGVNDIGTMLHKNSYIINKNIAYQYIFNILYYELQGMNNI